VQISSYGNDANWGTVRDAQRRTLELADTGMAVSLDVGVSDNVHPPDKETIASRLAENALGVAYGENVEFASPMFVQATPEGTSIRVWFSHANGLTTRGQSLDGFEVAGEDHKFVPATGKNREKYDCRKQPICHRSPICEVWMDRYCYKLVL